MFKLISDATLGRRNLWLSGGVLAAGLTAVLGVSSRTATAPSNPSSLDLDTQLGEAAWPDEAAVAQRIAATIQQSLADRYADGGPTLRDVHSKSHGCVSAVFRVVDDLKPTLAVGAFVAGKSYPAWIRFSNGGSDATRPDIRGDGRGMAIKVMGVPGAKLIAAERDAETLDFVLINHPVFFADDPARYERLIDRGSSKNPLVQVTAPLALGWRGMSIAREIASSKIASTLETRYWSSVPSRLGIGPNRLAVKYSARPCSPGTSVIPQDPAPDYLRAQMAEILGERDACFDFLVQARSGSSMSVEDSRTEWQEAEAPFVKVATLTIPRQAFDTAERDAFCEDLSFTPWHATEEHRPLGGVNRVRRVVYDTISTYRHANNGTPRVEPSPPKL